MIDIFYDLYYIEQLLIKQVFDCCRFQIIRLLVEWTQMAMANWIILK